MKNKFIYLAILAVGFASCEPEFDNEVGSTYTAGEADFTSYVAIGNSLTAGYMDGTMYKSGQVNSFPNLLAQKFALVGGGEFTQPSFTDDVNNLGGLMLGGVQIGATRLIINASVGKPQNIAGSSTIQVSNQTPSAYNNMGVPGAKSFHLLSPGYGNIGGVLAGTANPYFVRHATSSTTTVMDDAMLKTPTFFTNWIGANDVLAYATSGGTMPNDPLTPADESVFPANDNFGSANDIVTNYKGNDITSLNVFSSSYSTIVNKLTSGGAKGVLATIPSVTSIPYFTTVPYNALPAEATAANPTAIALYQFLALATGGRISPLNTAAGTKNPVLIKDADLSDIGATIQAYASGSGNPLLVSNAAALGAIYGQARHATTADLVVLPASSIIGQPNTAAPAPFNVNGVTLPLANKYVLTANEKAKVASATAAYNSVIVSIAATKNLAVADMNQILNQLVTGLQVETGQIYTANYFSGAATEYKVLFSLDGVHPNARGYAVITNEIIKVINSYYNSNLPLYNPSFFPGINILGSN